MLSLLSDIITPVRKRIEIALRGKGKLHGTIKKDHKMYRTTGRGGFPNRNLWERAKESVSTTFPFTIIILVYPMYLREQRAYYNSNPCPSPPSFKGLHILLPLIAVMPSIRMDSTFPPSALASTIYLNANYLENCYSEWSCYFPPKSHLILWNVWLQQLRGSFRNDTQTVF